MGLRLPDSIGNGKASRYSYLWVLKYDLISTRTALVFLGVRESGRHVGGIGQMFGDNVKSNILLSGLCFDAVQMAVSLFPVSRLLFHFPSFACYLSTGETSLNFAELRGAQTGASQKG